MGLAVWGWLYGAGRRDGLRHVARARKHAAKDELHGHRARPDRVYRGEGLEPQQEDSRNAAIKCAKVQTLEHFNTICLLSGPQWGKNTDWGFLSVVETTARTTANDGQDTRTRCA